MKVKRGPVSDLPLCRRMYSCQKAHKAPLRAHVGPTFSHDGTRTHILKWVPSNTHGFAGRDGPPTLDGYDARFRYGTETSIIFSYKISSHIDSSNSELVSTVLLATVVTLTLIR